MGILDSVSVFRILVIHISARFLGKRLGSVKTLVPSQPRECLALKMHKESLSR